MITQANPKKKEILAQFKNVVCISIECCSLCSTVMIALLDRLLSVFGLCYSNATISVLLAVLLLVCVMYVCVFIVVNLSYLGFHQGKNISEEVHN